MHTVPRQPFFEIIGSTIAYVKRQRNKYLCMKDALKAFNDFKNKQQKCMK